MKQQIFPLELYGRFYLKSPRSRRPSALNFIIRFNSKQYKFTTHTKIYPTQWNQSLQKAYISPILTNADNLNNSIVNQKIEEIKERFAKFKLYLCNIECNSIDLVQLLQNEFNDMAKKKIKRKEEEQSKFDDIVKVIHNAVYNDTTISKGTSDNYLNKGLPALKFYLSYLEREEKTKVDNFSYFTTEFFNSFAIYIYNNYTHGDGEQYTISTINSILKYAKSAIILCARAHNYLTEKEISSLQIKLFTDKSSSNHIALRNDEVMLLYNYQPTCKRDEEVRDIFLLECTFGHRITDILRLNERLDKIGGKYYITISPKKTPNKKVEVGIIFKIAKEILIDKYHCALPSITKDMINKNIKRIAFEAGIQGEELQSFHYQGESVPQEIKRPRHECISTHTGRRTFVSLLVARGWNYEQISKFTGQTIKMVEHYDKATNKYIDIYKDSLANRPNEIVQLCDEENNIEQVKQTASTKQAKDMNMDELLQLIFRTKDLFALKALHQNKVDILTLEKTAEINKYLEDINRVEQYKQQILKFFENTPEELKAKLIEILRITILLDPTLNTLKIVVTALQNLGLNCQYSHNTFKYAGKSAREAYILVTVTPNGDIIIK